MGGVRIRVALSAALVCLWLPASAHAAAPLQALAREKAAAVSIMRDKAANEIATVAQGRLFSAYLNATTQGEGLRIKSRIEAAFAVIGKRFGLTNLTLVDRGGEVIASSARATPAGTKFNVKTDAILKAGFAGEPRKAASQLSLKGEAPTLTYFAPVSSRGEKEFVLSAEQQFAAYRTVLARHLTGKAFVVLADQSGAVLADTRPQIVRPGVKQGAFKIAGLSLDALRGAVKTGPTQGFGEVGNRKERFAVAYEVVGGWVVITGEPITLPHRCPNDGERLCG